MQTKPAEICGVHRGPRRQVLVGGMIHRGPRPKAARTAFFALPFFVLALLCASTITTSVRAQEPPASTMDNPPTSSTPDSANNSAQSFDGLPVQRISFEGVPADRLTPLPGHLDQAEGAPLSADNV